MERALNWLVLQTDQGVESDVGRDVAEFIQVGITRLAVPCLELQSICMSRPDRNTLVAAVTRAMENIFVVVMVDVAGPKPSENPRGDQDTFLTPTEEPGTLPGIWKAA